MVTVALDDPGHAGGAVARLARERRRQPHLPSRLQDGGPGTVVGDSVRPFNVDGDPGGPGDLLEPRVRFGPGQRLGRREPLDVDPPRVDPSARRVASTTSMNGPGPQM